MEDGWISMIERPPEIDQWVLCYMPKLPEDHSKIVVLKYYLHFWQQNGVRMEGAMFTDISRSWLVESVSHWMPRPLPPKHKPKCGVWISPKDDLPPIQEPVLIKFNKRLYLSPWYAAIRINGNTFLLIGCDIRETVDVSDVVYWYLPGGVDESGT